MHMILWMICRPSSNGCAFQVAMPVVRKDQDGSCHPIIHQGPLRADNWGKLGAHNLCDLGDIWFIRSAIGQRHPTSYIPERVFSEITSETLEWCHSITHMTSVESLSSILAQGIMPMGGPNFLYPFNVVHPHHEFSAASKVPVMIVLKKDALLVQGHFM